MAYISYIYHERVITIKIFIHKTATRCIATLYIIRICNKDNTRMAMATTQQPQAHRKWPCGSGQEASCARSRKQTAAPDVKIRRLALTNAATPPSRKLNEKKVKQTTRHRLWVLVFFFFFLLARCRQLEQGRKKEEEGDVRLDLVIFINQKRVTLPAYFYERKPRLRHGSF